MRRAIVTGADGFLGRHLVAVLEEHGVAVTTLTRRARPKLLSVEVEQAAWYSARLADIIERSEPDAIFHMVGGAVGSEAELVQSNLGVTASIMQALRDVCARPLLVCCGSATEYGAAIVDGVPVRETAACAPVSTYGSSKLAQTKAALEFSDTTGTPVLVARIFNPIGPGMPPYLALGDFARQLAELPACGTLQTGNVLVYRDFIDVEHVENSLWMLAENPAASGIVNLCSGEATQLITLVEHLIELSGKKVVIQPVPTRMRPHELNSVVGSTTVLAGFGAAPPRTDYADVMARIWHHAKTRWATV